MNTKTMTVGVKMPTAGMATALDIGDNEFLAIISTPDMDRDGEVVAAGAFEPLPDRIVVEIDHATFSSVDRAAVRSVVGSGVPFYVGENLLIRGTWASTELAQEVRTLVGEGHVTKMSIAFSRDTVVPVDGVPHVTKGELLNVSFVTVPANRRADVLASKSTDVLDGEPKIEEGSTETSDSSGDNDVAGIVLGLDRPEHIEPEHVDEWTDAVRSFATSWAPPGDQHDPGQATDDEGAADAAPEQSAAHRRRQRARAQAVAAMATNDSYQGVEQ